MAVDNLFHFHKSAWVTALTKLEDYFLVITGVEDNLM